MNSKSLKVIQLVCICVLFAVDIKSVWLWSKLMCNMMNACWSHKYLAKFVAIIVPLIEIKWTVCNIILDTEIHK
jgi:hypothetical protein